MNSHATLFPSMQITWSKCNKLLFSCILHNDRTVKVHERINKEEGCECIGINKIRFFSFLNLRTCFVIISAYTYIIYMYIEPEQHQNKRT